MDVSNGTYWDIPGLREFDGYLDIRNIPAGEIAAALFCLFQFNGLYAPRGRVWWN